jgi:hypothetical protein
MWWSGGIRRRKEALRLLRTVGGDVKKELGKSRLRQLFEIGILDLRGYSASDYYVLGLYKNVADPRKYMNRSQFDEVRRQWNPPKQGIFEFNKWIFGNYCTVIGIPTPRCYGLFHRQTGLSADGRPLRDMESLSDLIASAGEPLACKPIAGSHGDHVMVFDRYDLASRILTRANGQALALEDLYRALTGRPFPWLLQAKVQQHPALRELHASSVNTARVITLLGGDGNVEVLGAVLRIGVGSSEIDNTTGGGIAAPIDLETGICAAAMSESTIFRMARHPDSSCPIEGFIVPHWRKIKQTAMVAHQRLPFARSLGWDIAIAETGPLVLEVNGTWYQNHIQMTGKSLWETAFARPPAGPA